jgi:RNA polymerase sigma-70 factor, ECF subfamily
MDRTHGEAERLVEDHYDDVFRFLRHLTRHTQEAEDLTQQTFIRASKALDKYDGRSSLVTWLHRIAFREFLNWRRGRRLLIGLNPFLGSQDPRIAQVLDTEILLQALSKLPPKTSATFLLIEVQQLSIEEAGTVLGIPAGTVKSRLHDARRRLRTQLCTANEDTTHTREIYEH